MAAPVPTGGPALAAALCGAFVQACRLDVLVRKPGNVSVHSAGHGMQAQQFIDSAQAAAVGLCMPGATVGERIEAAVDASWQAAGCNTNLGIVLLCAPLLAAAERVGMNAGVAPLRQAVAQVLDGLTVADAAAAFRAIARANPGGLGRADAQDVHAAPTVTLRQAMALAADRDSLARQYRDGFADLFEHALPAFEAARAGGHAATTAAGVHRVFLVFLAGWPDSHIVRKHGEALAHSVMAAAQPWARRAAALEAVGQDPQWADWDDRLKQQALNPGSSADLTVATLLLAALLGQPLAEGG